MKRTIIEKLFNRETFLYAVFGALTSLLNVVMFALLLKTGMDYRLDNVITLVTVKIAAYICNKNFVFRSHCADFAALLGEIFRFIVARGATMLIDYFGLILLVELLHMPKIPSKGFVTVLVIVLNYVIGKAAVFKDVKH
jgi:putative flippase GtrA